MSNFVGQYNGSSFETAMGMEILADGTWRWGLSVGALDMRARGTWEQRGNILHLTSTPKPMEPEFAWEQMEGRQMEEAGDTNTSPPFLRVVWGTNGKPFQYGSAELTCRNGQTFGGQIRADGYPSAAALEYEDPLPPQNDPRRSCDRPQSVVLIQSVYNVRSKRFDLTELGWTPGQTARFSFHTNDMGVADFTGVTGTLQDGKLKLEGAQWPMELRQLPRLQPAQDAPPGED